MTSAVELAEEKVRTLTARKRALDSGIGAWFAKVQTGAEPETDDEGQAIMTVARESRGIARELEAAEAELQNAQQHADFVAGQKRQEDFDASVIEAVKARSEFQHNFRLAAVALGTFYEHSEKAAALGVAIANNSTFGVGLSPENRQALADLAQSPDPTEALFGEGLVGVVGAGWNTRITISPLHNKFATQKER